MSRSGKGSGGSRGKGPGGSKARGPEKTEEKAELNAEGIINLTKYIEGARAERVSRLKSDVESGLYTVDAEKVAERIIERAARAARGAVRAKGTKKPVK